MCGKRLPSFVNRLACLGGWVSFMLPQTVKSLNPIPDPSRDSNLVNTMSNVQMANMRQVKSKPVYFTGKGISLE